MNLILVFCHFCEIHGPSVVLFTKKWEELSQNTIHKMERIDQDDDEEDNEKNCVGCRFYSSQLKFGFRAFICRDKDYQSKFISQGLDRYINYDDQENEEINLIKHACVRSLSCEVCPEGREGHIFFGDDERGHVISYCFILKDSTARGFQRFYSILAFSKEKAQLLQDYDNLVCHFERIIKKLQNKAQTVYEEEVSQTSYQEKRAIRLNTISLMANHGSNGGKSPLNTQRSSSKARSLIDLTDCNEIYAYIHLEFCWILNANLNQKLQKPQFDTSFISSDNSLVSQLSYLSSSSVDSIRELYRFFGREKFRVALFHTVIGNEIVIRSKSRKLSKNCIMILSQLLPKSCIKSILEEKVFDDSIKCNFYRLNHNANIPVAILESENHLLIDILEKNEADPIISFYSKLKIPEKLPRFITDLEKVIKDMSFSDETLEAYLLSAKEEWLNKAKMVYAYNHGINPPRTKEQNIKLFQILNAQECDNRLLQYWMNAGLSSKLKANVVSLNLAYSEILKNQNQLNK